MPQKEKSARSSDSKIPRALQEGLDKLGHTPRCAATPALQEELQEARGQLSNMPHKSRARNSERKSHNHTNSQSSNPAGNQSRELTTNRALTMNHGSNANQGAWIAHAPAAELSNHPPPPNTKAHLNHHAELQRQIVTMQQQISRHAEIPPVVANSINGQLRQIAQSYNDKQMELVREIHKASWELDHARYALMTCQRQMQMIQQERDSAVRERDRLLSEINNLNDRQRNTEDRIDLMEARFKNLNEDLKEKVKMQEEQISGKRSLWLQGHTSSSARNTNNRDDDVFTTPTGNRGINRAIQPSPPSPLVSSSPETAKFPAFSNQLGPNHSWDTPLHQPRPLGGSSARPLFSHYNLPTGSAQSNSLSYVQTNLTHSGWTGGSRAEAGTRLSNRPEVHPRADYVEPPASQALTLFVPEEKISEDFEEKMSKVFLIIEKWVKKFANKPNEEDDNQIPTTHASLWQYILGLTYRNLQDAHTHATHLLKDPKLRSFFVMRMVVDYIVRNMWSASAFLGFDEETEKELRACKTGLSQKGLEVQERQKFVTRQSNCVQSIIDSKKYQDFRVERLHHHTKKLRDMLGALLNSGSKRSEAGAGISTIAGCSWDVAVKMYTSHLSFQIVFPDCGGKFNASTMITRDEGLDEQPLALQIRQVRLKLVITPVITMRDDRGHSIIAKNLQNAHVLTMR